MRLPDYLEVGDSFTFGNFKQDNLNKSSEIEWLVLDITDENILIISKYIICKRMYKSEYVSATWEYSEIRKWLNGEFMQNCFSKEERALIELSIIPNNNNLMGYTPNDDTQDYIFLLSTSEAERLFSDDKQRIAFLDNSLSDTRNPSKPLSWWLRSKGGYNVHAVNVSRQGEIKESGSPVNSMLGVRPAMRIIY